MPTVELARSVIMTVLGENWDQGESDDRALWVADAIAFVFENIGEPLRVDDVIAYLDVARRSLERAFRAMSGHSIHQVIIKCRVEMAKHLLTHANKPVTSVAYEAGFGSQSKLNNVFRRELGLTPVEFRRHFDR